MLRRIMISTFFLLFTSINTAIASVVLHDLSGHQIPFSSLQGKWVFINYWASWCEPCLEEIPELNRFYDEQKDNNVVMYGVNYDALPVQDQLSLIKEYNIRYPGLKQDPSLQLRLGDIRGVPVTFVFNPKGQLQRALYGGQTASSLKKMMK